MQNPGNNPATTPSDDLLERVVEQFTIEVRTGKQPNIEDYLTRYPQLSSELPDVLSSIAMIEGLKNFSPSTSQPEARFGNFELPKYLGEYRIVGELGRGGMGVVLEAVHETLGRQVAIKVMAPGAIANSQHLDRFHREAVAAASLHHTNIVSVFGAGEDQGFHFYVMEFVDGQSISQILKKRENENDETSVFTSPNSNEAESFESKSESASNSTEESSAAAAYSTAELGRFKWVAKTGLQIADALAYAHEKSILHRDIKPANLVLDKNDTVWLTDFGLAKPIGEGLDQTAMTKTGDILGTPQYMAPESFSGRYDCRSETYCLGLTLYELATLKPAYANASTAEVIRAVTTATPTAPRKIEPTIPADLATVIEKAIAKEPEQRYQTAAELRDDLRAFLEDRPIAAKRLSLMGQFVRFSRRNRLAASLMGLLLLTLGLLAATAAVGYVATSGALQDLKQKQISLQKEQQATQQALQLADENARQIESQYQRAETNVDVALEAFDQVFRQLIARGTGRSGDLDIDGFQQMAGIEKAITKEDAAFIEKLLAFYQRLAVDNDHNRDFRTQSATAYRRIANVYRLVGENEKSNEAYQSALEIFNELLAEEPQSLEALLNVVATRNEWASLIVARGQWLEAMTAVVESRDQLENYWAPEELKIKIQMVKTLNQLTAGSVSVMFGPPEPERHRNWDGSVPIDPPKYGRRHPPNLIDMVAQILSESSRAVGIADELKEQYPDDVEIRVIRAESLCYRALFERGKGGDTTELLSAAMDELEGLQQNTPDQPRYQYLLAMTRAIASRDEDPEESRALLQEAQTTLQDLVSRFGRILSYRQLYAAVSIELAGLQISNEELADAKDNLVRAGDLLVGLKADSARDFGTRVNGRKLQDLLKKLGDSLAANGEFNSAAEVELVADRFDRALKPPIRPTDKLRLKRM